MTSGGERRASLVIWFNDDVLQILLVARSHHEPDTTMARLDTNFLEQKEYNCCNQNKHCAHKPTHNRPAQPRASWPVLMVATAFQITANDSSCERNVFQLDSVRSPSPTRRLRQDTTQVQTLMRHAALQGMGCGGTDRTVGRQRTGDSKLVHGKIC